MEGKDISSLCDEIDVDEVILFGSYAKGDAKKHSDIDLAIISDWFQDKMNSRRQRNIFNLL
jgi:predicted nucleotidyltransferase